MPTNYPTSLDDLAADNPAANDPVDGSSGAGGKPHHAQHDDLNSAVDALESTVGVTGAFNFALLASANVFTADNTFHGHVAFGAQSAINDGSLIFPASTFFNVLTVEEEFTNLTSYDYLNSVCVQLVINPAADATAQYVSAYSATVEVPASSTHYVGNVFGYVLQFDHNGSSPLSQISVLDTAANNNGSGTIDIMYGQFFQCQNGGGGGHAPLMYGSYCQVQNTDPGVAGDMYGYFANLYQYEDAIATSMTGLASQVTNYGVTSGAVYGVWVNVLCTTFGSVPSAYGVFVNAQAGSGNTAVTNNYGIWVGDQDGIGTSNSYNLWSDGAGKNHFGGLVEVGSFKLATGAGAGKVLTSDGSGNASWGVVAGTGTVTAVSVATANGFAGTSSGGATPALTLTTSITGVLKGNGTALSASNVTDDAQTKAAIVPNTAPTAGQLLVGNAGGTAYAPVSMSADATLASTGAITLATVPVTKGGTALTTLTAHALYAGNGTSAPTAVGPGSTDGVPLVATGASTDPAFRATGVNLASSYGVITDDGNSGTGTVTFNLSTSNRHKVALTGTCTFAVSNATTGQDFKIRIAQGSGPYTVTWFSGITWVTGSGAAAPTLPTGNGSVIVVMFECTGTNTYDGYIVGTSGA